MPQSSEERVERVLDIIAAGAREAMRCELEASLQADGMPGGGGNRYSRFSGKRGSTNPC